MFSKIFGNICNKQRRTPKHGFAGISNSQQQSALRNNESTSGYNGLQHRDAFSSANGQNNGNLLVGNNRRKPNRMSASSFDLFSKKRLRSQMKRSLDTWAKSGTDGENRCIAKKRILRFLKERNATNLDLTNLHLKSLPEEIGNLAGLRELHLASNQLTALPDSIGNLTGLCWLNLNSNQLTTLPDSIGNLTQLETLSLLENQLTVLPDSIGNLTRLNWLSLFSNQLTVLPDSIGNLSRLSWLGLSSNHLTALPQGIYRLTQRARIRLEQNPLSQQTIVSLTQRTDGPQISFSIMEVPELLVPGGSRNRSFEDAIKHYCSDIKPEHLQNLLGSENAVYFGQLLNRLDGTAGPIASAEAALPGFSDRVAAVISTLAEVDSAELRANCYWQAQQGLETCGDRVAITFSDIEMACKSQRILQSGGGDQQMAQLLRGLFRLHTLDAFARSDIASRQGGIDDIEIFLAYRVGLKDQLELPCETGAMLHNAISGVDQDALNLAKVHVITTETADNSAALVNFAMEQPFWNLHMERNQRFQKEKQEVEATFQKLGEELEERAETMSDLKYTQEYNTMAANRDAKLKDVQRKYTGEILHHL